MFPQRADRIGGTPRRETAHRGQRRGNKELIATDRQNEEPGRPGGNTGSRRRHLGRFRCCHVDRVMSDPGARTGRIFLNACRKSAASEALLAVAAGGKARTTRSVPAASSLNIGRTSARNRRVMRCRTTEFPTFDDTTKPTRAGREAARSLDDGSVVNRCTASCLVPERRPNFSTAANSAGFVRRISLGSTAVRRSDSRPAVRPRVLCDPCPDGRPGSRGPRGSASAGGTRGSWTGGGCSAETYACSRQYLQVRFSVRSSRLRHHNQSGPMGAAQHDSVSPSAPSRVRTHLAPGQGERSGDRRSESRRGDRSCVIGARLVSVRATLSSRSVCPPLCTNYVDSCVRASQPVPCGSRAQRAEGKPE